MPLSTLTETQQAQRAARLRMPVRPRRRQRIEMDQRRQREQAATRLGFGETLSSAVHSEWLGSHAIRKLRVLGFDEDPDFNVDDHWKELTEGIRPTLWGEFDNAVSLQHAERIREDMLGLQESREKLEQAGWSGTAAQMGAMILDPAAIAISIAGAKIGGPAVYGSRLSRMQHLIRGGLVAGSSEAAIEGSLMTMDPEREWRDVAYAAAGGFGLGGSLNMWAGSRAARRAREVQRAIEFDDMVEAAVENGDVQASNVFEARQAVYDNLLTEKGQAYFGPGVVDGRERQFVESLITRYLDPAEDAEMIAELRKMEPEEAAQFFGNPRNLDDPPPPGGVETTTITTAREAPRGEEGFAVAGQGGGRGGDAATRRVEEGEPLPPPPPGRDDLDLSGTTDAAAWWAPIRFSIIGRLGSSRMPSPVRKLANMLFDDALMKADGSPSTQAAAGWKTRQMRVRMTSFYRDYLPGLSEWSRATGRRGQAGRTEFSRLVSRAVLDPESTSDPHVLRAANAARRTFKEVGEIGKRHGVPGFDRFDLHDQYLPRIYDTQRIQQLIAREGSIDGVARVYANAIMRSQDVDENVAMALGRGMVRRITHADDLSDFSKGRLLDSGGDRDALERMIRDELPDLSDAEIDQLLRRIAPREPDPRIPRARRRVQLDEDHKTRMADGSQVSVRDLAIDNVEVLAGRYINDVTGASAMQAVYRGIDPSGDITSWSQLRSRLERTMKDAGLSSNQIEATLQRLDVGHRAVAGLPMNPDNTTNRVLRTMRLATYARDSGGFGVAQLPDMGAPIMEVGLRNAWQQMPNWNRIMRLAQDGQLTDGGIRELEAMVAAGTERIRNQVVDKLRYSGEGVEHAGGQLEMGLRKIGRVAGDVSGMSFANMFLQRWSASLISQKLTDAAFTGKRMSAKRRADLGLSEQMADRVYAQIRKHATTDRSPNGIPRWRNWNIDEWDDKVASAALHTAIDRFTFRTVQVPDIGNLSRWMTTDMGRSLIQFRTFAVSAFEKQLLHRIQMHDTAAFTSMLSTATIAGAAYIVQQNVLATGLDPQAKRDYFEERLNPTAIARAAVQRSPWSSMAPMVADSVWGLTGGDAIFNFRNSELSPTAWGGNPTGALIHDTYFGVRGMLGSARAEQEFTQQDARRSLNLLPFRNVMGIKNVIEATAGRFPEDE